MKTLYNTIIVLAAFMVLLGMAKLPSSGPAALGSTSIAPAHIISTVELQTRLNKQYPEAKLAVDGRCGKQTQLWWDRAYGDQCAKELWPEWRRNEMDM